MFNAVSAYESVSIIGIAKNAGKTTVFNTLIAEMKKRGIICGITSIGRDGETKDIVTGTEKPPVYIYSGTIAATAVQLLKVGDVSCEILHTTGMSTPMGEVIVFRAKSDGYVQLGGPSINSQIHELKAILLKYGAKKIVIDGAISRRSLSSPFLCESCLLCVGASYGVSMERTVRRTAFISELYRLEKFDAKRYKDAVTVSGALTDKLADGIFASGEKDRIFIVGDASKFMLDSKKYELLKFMGHSFVLADKSELAAICINPYSTKGAGYDAEDFLTEMKKAVDLPVFNVLA